jgi:hypothetical protein
MIWRCRLKKREKCAHMTLIEPPLYEKLIEKSRRRLEDIIKMNIRGDMLWGYE